MYFSTAKPCVPLQCVCECVGLWSEKSEMRSQIVMAEYTNMFGFFGSEFSGMAEYLVTTHQKTTELNSNHARAAFAMCHGAEAAEIREIFKIQELPAFCVVPYTDHGTTYFPKVTDNTMAVGSVAFVPSQTSDSLQVNTQK